VTRKQVEAGLAMCLTIMLVMTGSIWGFAHYKGAFTATEDVRLQNAKFEEERSELLTKLTNLEQAVVRTERFASRLENSIGLDSDEIQKGIGPIIDNDFSEPLAVRQFDVLKFSDKENKLAFADLDIAMGDLESTIAAVEERLQTVYDLHQDRLTYWASMPSIWPSRGWLTSDFGPRRRPVRGGTTFHKGIDIAAKSGTPVLSPGDGLVTFSGYKGGLGKTVMVDHGYGVVTVYGHNSENFVKEGDRIRRGELIGSIGRTGVATGSHLHYQIEVDGVPVDPMRYIQRM
jgi:murein DD-endopeptidase MepM/ murein hydrolase activator NlpD